MFNEDCTLCEHYVNDTMDPDICFPCIDYDKMRKNGLKIGTDLIILQPKFMLKTVSIQRIRKDIISQLKDGNDILIIPQEIEIIKVSKGSIIKINDKGELNVVRDPMREL